MSRQDARRQLFRGLSSRLHKKESPASEPVETTDSMAGNVSTLSNDSVHAAKLFIQNNMDDSDLADEYDYKVFSTQKPMRMSKIRALEQAETTCSVFFSCKARSSDGTMLQEPVFEDGEAVDSWACVPGLTGTETVKLLGDASRLNSVASKDLFSHVVDEEEEFHNSPTHEAAKERVHRLGLERVFQTNGDFLYEKNMDELDELARANMELEASLQEMNASRANEIQQRHSFSRQLASFSKVQDIGEYSVCVTNN